LNPEKVDKLVFVYTNARSLRNDTTVQVDDDELIGMEDDILQGVLGKRKRDVDDREDRW